MSEAPALRAVLFDFGGTLDSDGIAWSTCCPEDRVIGRLAEVEQVLG